MVTTEIEKNLYRLRKISRPLRNDNVVVIPIQLRGRSKRSFLLVSVAAHLRGMRPALTERKATQCLEQTQTFIRLLTMTLLCILTVVHIYGYVYIRILNNAHKCGYVFIRKLTDPD